MAKFIYNNIKNASISHISFKPNYKYYLYVFYKEDINPCPKSKTKDKFARKLQELIIIYWEHFYYIQKF